MTCKECLHYVVCKAVSDSGKFALDTERPDQSERCPNFADKSRFVELPCKIGDEVYRISFANRKKVVLPREVESVCCYGNQGWMITTTEDWLGYWLGKEIFLTREEAEAREA